MTTPGTKVRPVIETYTTDLIPPVLKELLRYKNLLPILYIIRWLLSA